MRRWQIHHKDLTRSTNLDARGARPWDVFTASFQTAGRGRLDHKWVSSPNTNLAMSAVLPAGDIFLEHLATLPLAVGLAVANALSLATGGLCRIKWPNDILVNGRKVAGILCEKDSDNVIAGIGVNVRERVFPEEFSSRATSLALLGCDESFLVIERIRDLILSSLSDIFDEWKEGGFGAIYERVSLLDALKGTYLTIVQTDDDASPSRGICGGILPDGSLDVGGNAFFAGEAHIERFDSPLTKN